jgi:MurNAc alpha-1-phosphate uridylyltransferase
MTIRRAMILAAGRGTRMRHLSLERPKPLTEVAGRTLLDRILDHLKKADIKNVAINIHYLSEMLETHLAARQDMDLHLIKEQDLLETGGGVVNALPFLGSDPFFCINADALWRDGPTQTTLDRLQNTWNQINADVLLLLRNVSHKGDFFMTADGRLKRPQADQAAPLQYAGVQIINPAALTPAANWPPVGAWSLNQLYNRAIARGRLFGLVHDGSWWHVGTPEDLADATRDLMALL